MAAHLRSVRDRPFASVVENLWRESRRDRIGGLAAEVAFFAILSVFPGLLMVTTALGSIDAVAGSNVAQEARTAVVAFLEKVLTERATSTVDAVDDLFTRNNGGIFAIATLVALLALSRGFAAMIRALNIAYDIGETRTWVQQRIRGLALAVGTVLLAIVILTMMVTGPLLGIGRAVFEQVGLGETFAAVWEVLTIPLAAVLSIAWAILLFRFGPNHSRTLWSHLPGAVLTGFLWVCASVGFGLYIRVAAATNELLGALGGGLILMSWLYLLSIGLLLGAELNDIWDKRQAMAGKNRPAAPSPAEMCNRPS